MALITTANFAAADDFYEALIETHRELSVEASHALNARLILILANHIGATDVLLEALSAAQASAPVAMATASSTALSTADPTASEPT